MATANLLAHLFTGLVAAAAAGSLIVAGWRQGTALAQGRGH